MVAGPAHAVGLETGVALELAQRGLGLGAEDAVLAAGVEAERVQPALQLGHVVAAQHRPAQVEQPIAERYSCSRSARPTSRVRRCRRRAARARLERAHGRVGLVAELAVERDA